MSITPIIHRTAVCLTILTSLGILVHDTRFDTAVTLALPFAAATLSLGAVSSLDIHDNAHTHIERGSLKNAFATGTPRIQPRDDNRRYLQKIFSRTTDPLSGSNVIWPNV